MRTHPTLLASVVVCAFFSGLAPTLAGTDTATATPVASAWDKSARQANREWSLRQTPVVEVVKRVRGAVVNIHSERTAMGPAAEELFSLAPSQNRVNGMGTGIIIDPRGYIITNHHVVEDVNVIRVRLADGTTQSARVVARDAEADLALLKIEADHPLPTMPLGTASDLMVGETVVAIGNAYGYEHSVTVGVVSAVGRDVNLNKEVSYKALIQTDASINPGNSGGPLLNVNGELIGVNVAIRAGAQGIGFAIPVDTMIRVAGSMLAGRPLAGLTAGLQVKDDVRGGPDEPATARQVVVERLEANGPAAKAGLQRGDVLLRVGDQKLANSLDLSRGLLDHTAGDKVPVIYRRGSAEQKAELVLEGSRVAAYSADPVWRKLGLHLEKVPAESVARTHPQLHGGMVVLDVQADGVAARAGIQRGDILIGLHQWEMLSQENILYVLNHPDLAAFNPLRFYVLRAGQVHRGVLQVGD